MKTAVRAYSVLVIAATIATMAGWAGPAQASNAHWQNQVAVAYAQAPGEQLDLESLERRLKKTDSLGLFTKLVLKAELDELLEDFGQHHSGRGDDGLEPLMARFESLVSRTLMLVRKGDAVLFRTLAASRGALRTVFSDPEKFAAAMGQTKRRSASRPER